MTARKDHLAEIRLGVDALLVEDKAGHIVARSGIGINKAEILSLEVFDRLVGAVLLHIEDRVVTLGTIGVHIDAESIDLDAGDQGAGEGC